MWWMIKKNRKRLVDKAKSDAQTREKVFLWDYVNPRCAGNNHTKNIFPARHRKRYLLFISLILSFANPCQRLRYVIGIVVKRYPRTYAVSGNSTVMLK
jgi:hypothetical protein